MTSVPAGAETSHDLFVGVGVLEAGDGGIGVWASLNPLTLGLLWIDFRG
jgi:hypothetical protein